MAKQTIKNVVTVHGFRGSEVQGSGFRGSGLVKVNKRKATLNGEL